jgi:hypothetical protein
MRQNYPNSKRQNEIIKTLLISLFIISSLTLNSQTPTNFSGKWEYDKSLSDKEKTGDAVFKGTIILAIDQNPSTISFSNAYSLPGQEGMVTEPDSFLVDGRETIAYYYSTEPTKKFVKWSQDKKILTATMVLKTTLDSVEQDFIVANTYKLSDDGNTLFNEEFHKSKLNGENTIKKVYKKK